jgi:hypothetical protein
MVKTGQNVTKNVIKTGQEQCLYCAKSYSTNYSLNNHVRNKHKDQVCKTWLTCPTCLQTYPNEKAIFYHSKFCKTCVQCEESFKTPHLLKVHLMKEECHQKLNVSKVSHDLDLDCIDADLSWLL